MQITVLLAVWHVMKKGPQGYSWGGDTFNPLFLLEAVPMSYGVFAALSCSFDEVLPFVIQMSRAEWYCSSNTRKSLRLILGHRDAPRWGNLGPTMRIFGIPTRRVSSIQAFEIHNLSPSNAVRPLTALLTHAKYQLLQHVQFTAKLLAKAVITFRTLFIS